MSAQNDINGGKKKNPILIGCGIGCGLLILIGLGFAIFAFMGYKKVDQAFTDGVAVAVSDLQDHGYSQIGEDVTGKGLIELAKRIASDDPVVISQPTTGKVFGFGKIMTVDAPCKHDILFVGQELTLNQSVDANVCVYSFGKNSVAKITIKEGVKVKKLFTSENVVVINNGSIAEGPLHNMQDCYDFSALKKKVEEKLGDKLGDLQKQIDEQGNAAK